LIGHVPQGNWQTVTFVAGLRPDRLHRNFPLDPQRTSETWFRDSVARLDLAASSPRTPGRAWWEQPTVGDADGGAMAVNGSSQDLTVEQRRMLQMLAGRRDVLIG
jgi:hypothetical protein